MNEYGLFREYTSIIFYSFRANSVLYNIHNTRLLKLGYDYA